MIVFPNRFFICNYIFHDYYTTAASNLSPFIFNISTQYNFHFFYMSDDKVRLPRVFVLFMSKNLHKQIMCSSAAVGECDYLLQLQPQIRTLQIQRWWGWGGVTTHNTLASYLSSSAPALYLDQRFLLKIHPPLFLQLSNMEK